jgi:hypothetical protein
MHPSTAFVLQFFALDHLKPELRAIVRPFAELAAVVAAGPSNAATTLALWALVEAKDHAVRAVVAK